MTALVINDTVDDLLEWLVEPPGAVDIEVLETRAFSSGEPQRYAPTRKTRVGAGPIKAREKLTKGSADVADIQMAVGSLATDAVVPFAQSPVDLTSLSDLFLMARAYSTWIVSPRTNPFLLLELPVGFLLIRAVQGVGQGVRRGLSEAVHYRLLQYFKVPDDWRPGDE